jgi:hypothetical protein
MVKSKSFEMIMEADRDKVVRWALNEQVEDGGLYYRDALKRSLASC